MADTTRNELSGLSDDHLGQPWRRVSRTYLAPARLIRTKRIDSALTGPPPQRTGKAVGADTTSKGNTNQ